MRGLESSGVARSKAQIFTGQTLAVNPAEAGETKAISENATFGPSTKQTYRRASQSPGVLHGLFKPAVAAVLTAALSVSLLVSPASAQTRAEPETRPAISLVEQDSLTAAFSRLLAADANQDGKVVGRRYGNELQNIDPMARAMYDYIDFVNPRGRTSLWGSESRGDYSEGGLGLGFTLRPKHMTGNSVLLEEDLAQGFVMLRKAMSTTKTDLAAQDLNAIRAAAKSQLGLSGAVADSAIWEASDKLLERIVDITEAKEIATNNTTATPTYQEVIDGLEAGSLERIIAETTLGHESSFFARELATMAHRRAALGAEPRNEGGKVSEAAMQYVLLIAKRAKEAQLIKVIETHMVADTIR